MSGSGKELGAGYVNFARNNIDLIRSKINDDLWILNFFEQWYTKQITILCTWLSERLDHGLHVFQCTCLSHIVKVKNYLRNENEKLFIVLKLQKIYSDFELQGVMEDKLNSKAYQTVAQRMQAEEATCQLTMTSEDGEDEFGDGDDDDGAASVAASKTSKIPVLEKLGDEDGNISVSSVSNLAKAKVGNLLGKGIGFGNKFGSFF